MTELYIPKTSYPLNTIKFPQIRLGIQSRAGEGKTTSALTFPNPIVLDFDNKLGAHVHREDVKVVPFWDSDFINNILQIGNTPYSGGLNSKYNPALPINRRDALKIWLIAHASKFTREQTVILDSWTSVQNAFDEMIAVEPVYTDKGKVNDFAPWQAKISYSAEICALLKSIKAHVIVTFHEMAERDPKSGQLLDKLQPLMQGKFVCQIAAHFTDFFRLLAIPKKRENGEEIILNAPPDGKYHLTEEVEYFWQIKQDEFCNANTTTLNKARRAGFKFVPASFKSFEEWK